MGGGRAVKEAGTLRSPQRDAQHLGNEVAPGRTTFERHVEEPRLKARKPEAERNPERPRPASTRSLDSTKDTLIWKRTSKRSDDQ